MPKVVPEYKAQARQRIVEAAQRVFAKKGFGRATMDDIADEVGVSKGALYLYFANKSELLVALQQAGREFMAEQLEQLLESEDLPEGVTKLVDEFFIDKPDRGVWFDLVVEAQGDPNLQAALREDWTEDRRTLRRFLQQLKERGRLPEVKDLDMTVNLTIAVLEHAAGMYMLGFDRRETRATLVRSLRSILEGGQRSPRAKL